MSLGWRVPAPEGAADVPDQVVVLDAPAVHHAVVDRPVLVAREQQRPAVERRGPPITPQAADDVVEAVRRSLAVEAGAVRSWARWELSAPVQDFVRAAVRHRVIGIIASHGDVTGLDPAACALLRPAVRAWAMEGMALAGGTARLHRVLDQAGLPHLIHKGAALAVQTTGRAEARGGGDIDVLLDVNDAPAAHRALLAAGWRPRADGTPVPGAGGAWLWSSFADRERAYDGPAHQVDLHWRIGRGDALFPPTLTLLDRAVRLAIGGTPVPTLCPPDALLAACYTAVVDELSSARHLLDVARLLRLADPADLNGLGAAARRLVRDVTGLVTELLGPVGPRHAPVSAGHPAAMRARWEAGSVWGIDRNRRVPKEQRVTPPLGLRLAQLGRSLTTEPGASSWARLLAMAMLPSTLLADGSDASPWRTVLRRGGERALHGCLPRR